MVDITSVRTSLQLPTIVTKTPILNGTSPQEKREEIRRYFHDTFTLHESLYECLSSDASFFVRPNPLRHPLIFYYGHTSVFFINKLVTSGLINDRVDEQLESIFAVGVDENSWDDVNQDMNKWPTVSQIRAHRMATRIIVDQVIQKCAINLPIMWEDPLWIVMMGIEHERIHLETSSVLIRELPISHVRSHKIWGNICRNPGSFLKNDMLDVHGGDVKLGRGPISEVYAWDNEYGRHEETVEPFRASRYLVSNGEFLAFVKGKGYSTREFWTDEGWNWVTFKKAKYPAFWIPESTTEESNEDIWEDARLKLRTMLEEIDMPWGWPVEVNYLEAKAFCNWRSVKINKATRLPTEAEYQVLRDSYQGDQPDWESAPGNINLEGFMSSCPIDVNKFPGFGFFDVMGNVWQWTETPFFLFEGFKPHPAYDDFSEPASGQRHNIFKGGCWLSTGNYALRYSRYAFRRHFVQHSGFRYVEGGPVSSTGKTCDTYNQTDTVTMYVNFHYGKPSFGVPNYPARCAREAIRHCNMSRSRNEPHRRSRALDIGCASGRASFELALEFDHVDAVDFSVILLEAPCHLQKSSGKHSYSLREEGDIFSHQDVLMSDFPEYSGVLRNVHFAQGDACNLGPKLCDYDLILASNLIDRLYDPAKFLTDMKNRVKKGGTLVLTSPYTWLEEFCPKDKWLGGFKSSEDGSFVTSLQGIERTLSPQFVKVGKELDIEFVIRETARKHQHSITQFSAWRKL